MKFTKMHGAGNDYVYINGFEETINSPEDLSIRLSDRHFGIGADGLILIRPSEKADCFMDMYNADGSRGKMCGNGIRCVGKYVYEHGIAKKPVVTVETLSGVKSLELKIENDIVSAVTVDMGSPILDAPLIPTTLKESGPIVDSPIRLPFYQDADGIHPIGTARADEDIAPLVLNMTCVSMGNPHAVILVEDTDSFPVGLIGPYIEKHPAFPENVNVSFITIKDASHIDVRTWERGSGETLACGTGNCASLVAATLLGKCDGGAEMSPRGGKLQIRWDRHSNTVYLTGGAAEVFSGEFV